MFDWLGVFLFFFFLCSNHHRRHLGISQVIQGCDGHTAAVAGKQLLGKLQRSVLRTLWYCFLQRVCLHLSGEMDLNWGL